MFSDNISFFLKSLCWSLFSLIIVHNAVFATELTDKLHFNGFLTLDATVTSEDLALVSNSDQVIVYEENSPSLKNSLIGGQFSYSLTDNIVAVVQGKLYDKTNIRSLSANDSIAQLDWAYISYDFGADFKARAGLFQVPFMQGTELRSVGFSRLWARPLIPSSGAGGYKEYTGVELLKHVSTNEGNWDFQLAVGKAEHGLDTIDNKHTEVLSIRYQQGDFWLRSALLAAQYQIYTADKKIISDSASAVMLSIESEYVLGNYLLNAGYSTSKADITPDDTNYYFSVAYQFDGITPFIYYSHFKQSFEPFTVPQSNRTQPPGVRPTVARPPPPVQRVGDINVYNWAIGARYNISERYAFKLQVEHITEENSANFASNNGEGNALSIVLEGVF